LPGLKHGAREQLRCPRRRMPPSSAAGKVGRDPGADAGLDGLHMEVAPCRFHSTDCTSDLIRVATIYEATTARHGQLELEVLRPRSAGRTRLELAFASRACTSAAPHEKRLVHFVTPRQQNDARGAERRGNDLIDRLVDAMAAFRKRERVIEVSDFSRNAMPRCALRRQEPT